MRLLIPTEHGSFVKLQKDGSMVVHAMLPTATSAVDMKLVVARSGT